MKKVLLVATVVVAAVVPVGRAEAAPGGAMTAVDGLFTGTSGDDILIIGRAGDSLSHNRFAAGDPGFATATDFDSTQAGTQTKGFAPFGIGFNSGGGDDVLRLVSVNASPLGASDFGPGSDTLDFSQATEPGAGISFSPSGPNDYPTLETIIGTPYDDEIGGNSSTQGIRILGGAGNDRLTGSPGPDVLDGGSGVSSLLGLDGDDSLLTDGPTAMEVTPRGSVAGAIAGNGNDTWIVRGTESQDNWVIGALKSHLRPSFVQLNGAPEGRLRSDAEVVVIEAGTGSDQFEVAPILGALTIKGGEGDDAVAVNARTATAGFTQSAGVRTFSLSSGPGHTPASITLNADVENASLRNETLVVTAPKAGGGPHVRAFRASGAPASEFFAYSESFSGGVNVAVGDVTGDGVDDIVTGAGPGGGPHVGVFSASGGAVNPGFFAYNESFGGGVDVATVDVDGDGRKEIVTVGQTSLAQPVRVWSFTGQLLKSFPPNVSADTKGLHVAAGAIDSRDAPLDERASKELIVLSSRNGFPGVTTVDDTGAGARSGYFPYGSAWTNGASVARADLFAPGSQPNSHYLGFVTGAGPGGGPHVRAIAPRLSAPPDNPYVDVGNFYAYAEGFGGGVEVATCNPDGGEDEVVTAPGAGGGPHVRMFTKTGVPRELSVMAYNSAFSGGVNVACGGGAAVRQL